MIRYIIYLTLNTVNNKIYVGYHKTDYPYKFDGYLGNGVMINDRHSYIHRKTPFEAAVAKYGVDKFRRTTLYVFDTQEEALKKEAEIVNQEFIARKDTYNIALGGNIPPAQTKTIYQYTLDGTFVKEWNSISEAGRSYKCSNSCIGKAVLDRTPSIGYLWSDYYQEKLDLNLFKLNNNCIPCYLYDVNGDYLMEFKSINDCADYIGVTSIYNPLKGKYLVNKKYYVSVFKYDKFEIPLIESKKNVPIYRYDLNGEYIDSFENYKDVQKKFKRNVNVFYSVRTGNPACDFLWSYDKVDRVQPFAPQNKPRKVGKYDLEGNLVAVFESCSAAKRDTCGAPNVLTGLRKTAGGHVFKYLD